MQRAGARLVRHGHDMVLDLPAADVAPEWAAPRLPAGLALASTATASLHALTRAMAAAYPPGHPDAGPAGRRLDEVERSVAGLLSGLAIGPVLHDRSALVTDPNGEVAGAVIVTLVRPEAWGWPGGSWVAEVLVVPAWQGRGLGRALLRRAIARCAAAGEACIGLTVTEGNPAERLYLSLGFERRRTLWVLDAGPAGSAP